MGWEKWDELLRVLHQLGLGVPVSSNTQFLHTVKLAGFRSGDMNSNEMKNGKS